MPSSNQISLILLLFFQLVLPLTSLSASASISDAVVGKRRSLLQVKKPCPVDMEKQNYTIVTSQCKAPDYPPEPCCSSYLQLVCPIATEMNDRSNDCSENLSTNLSKAGQYPSVLFSSICRGNKEGLPCPETPPSPLPNTATPTPLLPFSIIIALPLFFPLHFLGC